MGSFSKGSGSQERHKTPNHKKKKKKSRSYKARAQWLCKSLCFLSGLKNAQVKPANTQEEATAVGCVPCHQEPYLACRGAVVEMKVIKLGLDNAY